MMNTHIQAEEHLEMATNAGTIVPEMDKLVSSGFTSEEISSLLWLRQWYQAGGSDRVTVVRHWEFLKLLVLNGKLEV